MRGTACRLLAFQAALFVCGCLIAGLAFALPPGRAWAPAVRLDHPGVAYFGSPRVETDAEGVPFLIIATQWDTSATATWNTFMWRDSTWVSRFVSDIPSFSTPSPALSLTDQRFIFWVSPADPSGYARVVTSEIREDGFGPPDTAMVTTTQSSERAGAASMRRRWAVRSQQRFPVSVTFAIRTAYSDTFGVWHELPEQGIDEDHCTAAPLSDTSALVVYAGESGLVWAIAGGNRWTQQGNLDPRPLVAAHPRLRFRPSGGLWLLWTERPWVHVSEYRDGEWVRGDSLKCIHPDGGTYSSAWCDVSRDAAERPVLAWGDLGIRSVGCVAFPTDSGWMQGEEIPGSEDVFPTPYVTRDRNGDVWAAWRLLRTAINTNRWTHTYVKATASTPEVAGVGPARVVSWTLSEPAPESWWAVLRARDRGGFEQVARVQAAMGLAMSWTDTSAPARVQRYRIRRESLDARYRLESGEVVWPPLAGRSFLLVRLTSPARLAEALVLELLGAAAGSTRIRLYDLQGRVVLEQRAEAGGSGWDLVRLPLGDPLRPGMYFLRVGDSGGREAAPAKLVIVR